MTEKKRAKLTAQLCAALTAQLKAKLHPALDLCAEIDAVVALVLPYVGNNAKVCPISGLVIPNEGRRGPRLSYHPTVTYAQICEYSREKGDTPSNALRLWDRQCLTSSP